MTLDLGGPNRNVFYLNFESIGQLDPDNELGPQICQAEQNFNFANLIENASDYVIAIERFRLPLQGIPMLRAIPQAIRIMDGLGGTISTLNLPAVYSINDFLTELSGAGSGWTGGAGANNYSFSLTPGGQICIWGPWSGEFLVLDPQIAAIFDLPLEIVAETGLSNIQQEIITTNTFRNILTDFLIPSSWSASFNDDAKCQTPHTPAFSLSYPVRQDLEFNDSNNRRWIFMRGGAPIQNVGLKAEAILRDGTITEIPLPPRSVFQVKLSFWLKS